MRTFIPTLSPSTSYPPIYFILRIFWARSFRVPTSLHLLPSSYDLLIVFYFENSLASLFLPNTTPTKKTTKKKRTTQNHTRPMSLLGRASLWLPLFPIQIWKGNGTRTPFPPQITLDMFRRWDLQPRELAKSEPPLWSQNRFPLPAPSLKR